MKTWKKNLYDVRKGCMIIEISFRKTFEKIIEIKLTSLRRKAYTIRYCMAFNFRVKSECAT